MKESKSILFVDDEEEVLDILVELFSEEGYSLHTATKFEEAVDVLNHHNLDFVLSDLKLPDASGSDLLQLIREKSPETVRVLTSGYFDVEFGRVNENLRDGTLYLSKPWDLRTLKQLITERLG